jgi:predicted nucleic acid-binding protein
MNYVLDAWAVLAWLGGEEPASEVIQDVLEKSNAGSIKVSMSLMNFGEVFYCIAKKYDLNKAKLARNNLLRMPIDFVSIDDKAVWQAVYLKARYPISYADAFAAGLACKLKAVLLSGDPEFELLEKDQKIRVQWLSRKGTKS